MQVTKQLHDKQTRISIFFTPAFCEKSARIIGVAPWPALQPEGVRVAISDPIVQFKAALTPSPIARGFKPRGAADDMPIDLPS